LLVGMDVLRRTRAIAIDYARATVSFRIRAPGPVSIDFAGSDRRRR
jgi:hypothetical protein